ncbi:ATP-binding protein [Dendronalium sp. ChiSLP03b]|uniref:ATP-binding protein n=1 Tax=Dendronalium sp. ChiSLP03b TaxID=3075381 RepID=UPI002AD3C2E3|nr:ATP-binding protein [Dendronalium sp. ChiSLP03b]MDZ8205047.1 ATP-binding protein [Dendronalium sp. ChiSLP03b]
MSYTQEPIYFSGSIQPHGILLLLSHPELRVLQVSANTSDYLGKEPQTLLGQSLHTLLNTQLVEAIQQDLQEGDSVTSLKLTICTSAGDRSFNGTVHSTEEGIILELEPTIALTQENFFNIHAWVKRAIAKLKQLSNSREFLELAVQNIRQLTDFDRVIVYQFDPQGTGVAIAEAKQDDLSPYLGLHYPATNIPKPVRELYKRGLLQFVPDLTASSVELVPAFNPVTQQPLDLSLVALRSVNPSCVTYHQNMGVAAILVISLVHKQKLWGLITCHHQTPKFISSQVREACELLGQFIASELSNADELVCIKQELERSNQELDFFAYAASHDLKEPLRGIHNYSNLLLKGYKELLDDIGKARLQTLVRLTHRMESLIDALLKFSRLGQAELHLVSTDINLLVNQMLEDLLVSHQDEQPKIYIPRPLPTVSCDPILISEVFTNLLSNALKYNDKAEPWIEIGYLDKQGNQARFFPDSQSPITFYVRDNGIGIRERHQQIIFRLFKRLHEQNLYGGGTGVGLTIAKKIIERHGGRIWVESTLGAGSTFYFTLMQAIA